MDYSEKDLRAEGNYDEVSEPAVAYAVGGAAIETDDWFENGGECPYCKAIAQRPSHGIPVTYPPADYDDESLNEEYEAVMQACVERGYNQDTIDAIKEGFDADAGRITLKSYATLAEMNADIDADPDDEDDY
jgi:hypothetical protein